MWAFFKHNKVYRKLATVYWQAPDEIRIWGCKLISSIPGEIGVCLRSKYYPKLLGIIRYGRSLRILENVRILHARFLDLGDRVLINHDVMINAGGGVSIGDDVLIGPSAKIWSVNHCFDRCDIPINQQGFKGEPVFIESDVWIGANAIILPGCRIGKGAIVGAGSIVTKNVGAFLIVAGNPIRKVGERCMVEYHVGKDRTSAT